VLVGDGTPTKGDLLAINNTISYLWIKDITNREYAIPNYLTNRQLNVKLVTKFKAPWLVGDGTPTKGEFLI
jgi:hypothetical protein